MNLGGIILFYIVEKIVRRYEELSSRGGQRALGHTHHHHQKKKNKVKKSEGSEKIEAVGDVAALEDKESKPLESKTSDLKKVLSRCTRLWAFQLSQIPLTSSASYFS